MTDLRQLDDRALSAYRAAMLGRYHDLCDMQFDLNMTRGKPSSEQLELSHAMLTLPNASDCRSSDGTDCRNYGGLDGIPEVKSLFAGILDAPAEQIIVSGNSSLALMHDAIVNALLHGIPGGTQAWASDGQTRFICPTPGYDRHFAICEHLGIEMLPVEMTGDGPDMEAVTALAASDPSIKGIWCVPKYSNPTGITYGDEVVLSLAAMPTAADDFRIFWDNAYAVHHLSDTPDPLLNILTASAMAGNPNRVLMFASTSKISFAGAGIAAIAASPENIAAAKRHLSVQTIGPDKLNQLRHARFFGRTNSLRAHWKKHAAILKPKFDAVQEVLNRELAGKHVANWSQPRGGYFVNLDVFDGCAKEVIRLAGDAGVTLTPAGATFPHGEDPYDRNVRIAPSFPSTNDVTKAMEVITVCVQLAAVEQIRATRSA